MSRSSRHIRAAGVVVGSALVASAVIASSAGTANAAVTSHVVNHGATGVADALTGNIASPDGGTYNVGYQVVSGTNRAVLVTKSKADGTLDTTFGTGGRAVIDLVSAFNPAVTSNPGAKEQAKAVAVDKLGRILVLGELEGDQADAVSAIDTDVFVARLHPTGALDTSYGTNGGWSRISFSDGVHPTGGSGVVDAAGYDIFVRANQKVVFPAAIGTDSEGTRTARDAAAVQLTSNGRLDTTFGDEGVASIATPQSDNLRRGLLDDDGSFFVTTYASVGMGNQPFISKFDAQGAPDATWGDEGLATTYPGGIGGFAEAYGIEKDADGNYVVSGYGYRGGRTGAAASNAVDAILFSLTPSGDLNKKWGQNGFTSYHIGADGNSSADRHRIHKILPDGRIVGVGASGPTGSVDALITVTNPDGTPGETKTVDLGATDDHLWGLAQIGNGYQLIAAGNGNGDAQVIAIDLTPKASALKVGFSNSSATFGADNSAVLDLSVGGAPAAGSVDVTIDGTKLGTVAVGATGKATVALPRALSAGSHTVTASVAQAPGVAGTKSVATLTVAKASSASKVRLAKSKVKKSQRAKVTVNVTAAGAPATGSVTIYDGSKKIKTVSLTAARQGSVTVTLPKLSVKKHTIKAVYAGNGDVTTSSAKATLRVVK